ncbi:ribose-phosphate diphosphokinase [Streptomyces sp. SID14478]|nr:ribose-phosphate diphosphokinase [Streptomyces sp. SID14478]
MIHNKTTGERKLMLFSGRAHPRLATEVAACLGLEPAPTQARDFANGEIYIRYDASARGADCFVLQSHTAPINQWLMEQLIMIDALKRASARSITVIAPFYPYARQDKKHLGREPISARLVADLLQRAGAERLMCVDLHAAQIQGFFDGPVDHLFALPVLAAHVAAHHSPDQLTIVSPDAGGVRRADQWSQHLGAPLAIVHKRRDPRTAHSVKAISVVGDIQDRTCVLVDDMVDTAGTICAAADALHDHGAREVIVAATHAVLSDPAPQRLRDSAVAEFLFTDTLPLPQSLAQAANVTTLPIAPLIARAIQEVFDDGSVTQLEGTSPPHPRRTETEQADGTRDGSSTHP